MSSRFQIVPYSNTLLLNPEEMAPTLRNFHETNDPERWVIIDAILDVVSTEDGWLEHWSAFFDSELYKVCIDILTDDRTYEPDVPSDYAGLAFILLRRHGVHLSFLLQKGLDVEAAQARTETLLAGLPALWKYVWEKDVLAQDTPLIFTRASVETEDRPIALLLTLDTMIHLHIQYYGKPPQATNHMGHLALYAWTYSADDGRTNEMALRASILMVDYAPRTALKRFFTEAVLDKGIVVPLAERFCLSLLLEENYDSPLRSIASLLSAVSVHCEPVLHAPVERSPHTLMQCIRIACQRQLCHGADRDDTGGVLGAGLSVIKDIMSDCLEGGDRRLAAFFEMVDTVKIIPMVARATIVAINANDPSLFNCLHYILEIYSVSGECCRRNNLTNVMSQVFEVTRELWYPTIKEIRAHPCPLNDDKMPRIRDWALTTWLEFGKKLGFNERVEERRIRAAGQLGEQSASEMRRKVPGSRACQWKDCLCSWDAKPPHHMRVCKGCWRAWYCGPICQMRDWHEGDHKQYCYAHRPQSE